jgi:tRNA A-37 threonylcarbamoyl transferase component Bud32
MLDSHLANMPLPGELVAEKYRVERVLGKGGMGVVFAATHIQLQQRVAIKLLLPAAATDPETVQRFLREGRAAVKIRNEHVARVLDVGEMADRTPFLVMEYLEGSDFGELLDGETRLPYAQAVDYVLEACEAVAEAHSLKIVHRDLKPSNLFLARQPNGSSMVKVLDFGISKMLEPGLDMTRTAAMMGSPLYMSPEQLKSARDVDERSDIWSVGVILYQLIAGHPPFQAESLPELCAVVLSNPTRWLDRVVPEVPAELARIVATCLRSKVDERYVNLADFAEAVAVFGSPAAKASAAKIVALLGMPAKRALPTALPTAEIGLDETLAAPARMDAAALAPLLSTRSTWSAAETPKPSGVRALFSHRSLAAAALLVAAVGIGAVATRRAPAAGAATEATTITGGPEKPAAAPIAASPGVLATPPVAFSPPPPETPARAAVNAPRSSASPSPSPSPRRPPRSALVGGESRDVATAVASAVASAGVPPGDARGAPPLVPSKTPLGAATSSKD